jgi:transposase
MNMETIDLFVGIDVSKAMLDVAFGPEGRVKRFGNDAAGIAGLVNELLAHPPALVVMESTGGLEQPVLLAIDQAEMAVALVNPRRVRHFAQGIGLLAKTDRLDAQLLARFARDAKPARTILPSLQDRQLSALAKRRKQVLDMLTAEKNRQGTASPEMQPFLQEHIDWLEEHLKKVEQEIDAFNHQDPDRSRKQAILRSFKGIGPVNATTLSADLPELGRLDKKKIAALTGVAPFNDDSGHRKGKRRVKGGRETVRQALYMAAVCASRCNPVIRSFYLTLLKRGKEKKVALVACMHKMLTILNAMLRDGQPWHPPALLPVP